MPVKPRAKSDETRARIMDAAMECFRANGFESATMRQIAASAGVATGAAYYYFESKDAIVSAFYRESQQAMEPALEAAITSSRDLRSRLEALIVAKLEHFRENRRLLGALAAHADPSHSLSPFNEATREVREHDVAFFERALEASNVRIPSDLQAYLPRLLWLYQMGLILFWVYDRSPHQRRTRELLTRSLDVVVQLIRIAAFPLMRPARRKLVELLEIAFAE